MYISSIIVTGATQLLGSDYNFDYGDSTNKATVTFTTPPPSAANNVVITYYHGSNWIYPDMPRADASMPRIGVLSVGGRGETSGGTADKIVWLRPDFRISVWVRMGKTYTISGESYSGDKLLDYLYTEVQDTIRNMRHNNDFNGLIYAFCSEPSILEFDDEYKLKQAHVTVGIDYEKTY